jgi:phospholipid/cholesterol/gamma-HCH transport system substrate-binding protein
MENGRTFETIVGVFVLIVTVFFFNYVYSRSGWKNPSGYTVIAKFDKADGLSEGIDVKMSGVRIGKISKISLDPETFMAVVKFSVQKNIKLPKDTSASVASDGLFGGKYLSLTPGGEEEILKDGSQIENTVGPVNLESLIAKMVFSSQEKR